MTHRRQQIQQALEGLKANESTSDFEALATHLAKQRWPELVATERKSDGGEDATTFQRGADGKLRRLACSITGTLDKVRKDAKRIKGEGNPTDALVFVTTEPVPNTEVTDWVKKIKSEFNLDLAVLGQAELVSALEDPANDWLCQRYLHLPSVLDPERNLAPFLQSVVERCRNLTLQGLDRKAANPENYRQLELARVYIDLLTDQTVDVPAKKDAGSKEWDPIEINGRSGAERKRPATCAEMVARHARLVLTGQPGSGKTTFVRRLCLAMAEQMLHPSGESLQPLLESGWTLGPFLPIKIELREFARELAKPEFGPIHPSSLWDFFVRHELGRLGLQALQTEIQRRLTGGHVLVILEGLDEVANGGGVRARVKEAIEQFAACPTFRASRFLVTCRSRAYAETSLHLKDLALPSAVSFPRVGLADFDEDRIQRFALGWYAELARQDSSLASTHAARAARLAREVKAPSLAVQAGRPMMLTVMANLHASIDSLPRHRAEVYAAMVDLLVESWDNVRLVEQAPLRALLEDAKKSKKELLAFLGELAFTTHRNQRSSDADPSSVGDILKHGRDGLLERLATWCGSHDRALALIEAIEQRAGLLVSPDPGADVFQFPHRSFQEYLAGTHLADMDDFEKQAVLLATEAGKEASDVGYWDETICWAAGWVAHVADGTRRYKEIPNIANDLLDQAERGSTSSAHLVELAADILLEMGEAKLTHERTRDGKECLARMRTRLLACLGDISLPAPQRVINGQRLGRLGDPRPGVAPKSLEDLRQMEFCLVPAGAFMMGMDTEEKAAVAKQWPLKLEDAYRCDLLNQPYWIARHPVTRAQFRLFAEHGGYSQPAYWKEAATLGLWRDGSLIGRIWNPKLQKIEDPTLEGASSIQFDPSTANHPATEVNWFEALAFCRWLNTLEMLPTGLRFGLPSEPEWEKAARGGLDIHSGPIVLPLHQGLVVPDKLARAPNPHPQRPYPWGDRVAIWANTAEAKCWDIHVPGCFPAGASPCGAEDLGGNVWEWTRSIWGPPTREPRFGYPYLSQDGREESTADTGTAHVLRGGAWFNPVGIARCAIRLRLLPYDRPSYIGFRLVASPFFSAL